MSVLENARHEAFARAIVEGKSGRAAYAAAGYEAKDRAADANASRLLTNARVSARVAELKEQAAQGTVMTAREVLEGLSQIGRDNEDVRARLGALGLLGKYHKLFAERHKHTGKDGGPVEVKQYTDIEVARLIGRLLNKVAGASQSKTDGGST